MCHIHTAMQPSAAVKFRQTHFFPEHRAESYCNVGQRLASCYPTLQWMQCQFCTLQIKVVQNKKRELRVALNCAPHCPLAQPTMQSSRISESLRLLCNFLSCQCEFAVNKVDLYWLIYVGFHWWPEFSDCLAVTDCLSPWAEKKKHETKEIGAPWTFYSSMEARSLGWQMGHLAFSDGEDIAHGNCPERQTFCSIPTHNVSLSVKRPLVYLPLCAVFIQ